MRKFGLFSVRVPVLAVLITIVAIAVIVIAGVAQGFSFLKPAESPGLPHLFSYQGVLTDKSTGSPLDGSYQMVFKLYLADTGGAALWEETQDVTVENGLFNVYLGSVTPLDPLDFPIQDMYLGVTIAADQEMTPRLRLASAPFAITAGQSYCTLAAFYQDLDLDNFGNSSISVDACSAPAGYVSIGLDCDDTNQNINPSAPELCGDGLDNNCDGSIDEVDLNIGQACVTGQQGVCSSGTISGCSEGQLVCTRLNEPSAEVCDGQDNDCDGQTDEQFQELGTPCNTGQLGVCAAGTFTTCFNASLICQPTIGPSQEVCGDGLDNNCNGQVDEGCGP